MRRTLLVVAIQAVVLATSLCAAQGVKDSPKVLVKEVHFEGDLGLPLTELQEYTEYLSGRTIEQTKLLKEAAYAVGKGLQHRGYLKEQVTPQIHPLMNSRKSEDVEVALELTINAGRQYRVKEMTFSGLSSELRQADLTQAFDIHPGDIADAEKISVGITNLQTLFHRNGKDVAVIPDVVFDDAASTVSFRFVIEK